MDAINTQFTSSDGHAYAICLDSTDPDNATVYLSDESKNDVEIPICIFHQMAHIVDAITPSHLHTFTPKPLP